MTIALVVLVGLALAYFLVMAVTAGLGYHSDRGALKAPPPADGDDPRSQPVSRKEILEERQRRNVRDAATGAAGAVLAGIALKQLWDKRNEEAS